MRYLWVLVGIPLLYYCIKSLEYKLPFLSDGGSVRLTKRYPDIIIAGAPKCGTATLSDIMETHSAIVRTDDIEVRYYNRYLHLGRDWYLSQMPWARDEEFILEKTPAYFNSARTVVPQILQTNPSTKVILLLGDPVARIESQYAMYERTNKTGNRTLLQMVLREDGEVNADSNIVSRSQNKLFHSLLVLDADKFVQRPWEAMALVQDFIGISDEIREEHFVTDQEGYFCWKRSQGQTIICMDHTKKGTDHKTTFPEEVEAKLRIFFEPYDRKLVDMLGGQKFSYMDKHRPD